MATPSHRLPERFLSALAVFLLLGAVVTTSSSAEASGRLAKLKLSKKSTSLMRDRLTIRAPRRSKIEPRRVSIMAADESADLETRIVVEAKGEKMVIMAYELFALGGSNFDRDVRDLVGEGEGDYKVETLKLGHPALHAVTIEPTKLDLTDDAILVLGMYLAHRDNTVQFIGFYVNAKAGQNPEGVRALAKLAALTVRAGSRDLDTDGGERVLEAPSGKMSVVLPKGYIATFQSGPDFLVHSLRKLAPLGDDSPSLGIYLGGHPAYHHLRVGVPNVEKVKGKLLGAETEWHRWSPPVVDGVERTTMLEAISPLSAKTNGPLAHVFLSANDPVSLEELRQIAASIKPGAKP